MTIHKRIEEAAETQLPLLSGSRTHVEQVEYARLGFRRGANFTLTELTALLKECRELLECNKTFHRLGGIDDCEPCKMKAKLDDFLGDK